MQEIIHIKKLHVLSKWVIIDTNLNPSNVWQTRSNNGFDIFTINLKDFEKIVSDKKGTLENKKSLYFGKSSKFPRFKLSGFKRTIKVKNSDAVIIGDISIKEMSLNIYMDDLGNYYHINSAEKQRVEKNCEFEYRSNPIKFLVDNKLIFGKTLKEVFSGICLYTDKKYGIDIMSIIDGTYKNLITDNELDKKISEGLNTITEEQLFQVRNMLQSSDRSINGLGLKVLSSFNVSKTPYTIQLLLSEKQNVSTVPEWKSVGFQQVLRSINFKRFLAFPYEYDPILEKIVEDDSKLFCQLVKEVTIKEINKTIDYFNSFKMMKKYNIKLKLNLE